MLLRTGKEAKNSSVDPFTSLRFAITLSKEEYDTNATQGRRKKRGTSREHVRQHHETSHIGTGFRSKRKKQTAVRRLISKVTIPGQIGGNHVAKLQ